MRRIIRCAVALALLGGGRVAIADETEALEVEVVGELLDRPDPASVGFATRIEREDLRVPGRTLADTLLRIPGALVVRTGGHGELATVALRGGTSSQTPVYFAGVRINDDFSGHADLSAVDLDMLRRVDVYRGHAPIHLDRTGLTGAVLLDPEIPGKSALGLRTEFDSFGHHGLSGWAALGGRSSATLFGASLSASRNDFEFTDDRGTTFDTQDDVLRRRENADEQSGSVWMTHRQRLGSQGVLRALVATGTREQGIPGLSLVPARFARAKSRKTLFAVDSRLACSDDLDRCSLHLASFGRLSDYLLTDPQGELPLAGARQRISGASTGYLARLMSSPVPQVDFELGVRQSLEQHKSDPIGPAETSAQRLSTRLFGATRIKPAPWLDLDVLGAGSLENAGGQVGTMPLSPDVRVGATVKPIDDLSIEALGAYYRRTPTLGELYGASGLVLGNASLVPEESATAELGARYQRRHASYGFAAEVTGYGRFASELVTYRRSAIGALRPFNIGDARIFGAEALARFELPDWLSIDLTLGLSDPRDTSEDRTTNSDLLPFQTRLTAGSAVEFRISDLGPDAYLSELRLGSSFHHRSGRVADSAGLIVLPSRSALDLRASLSLFHSYLALTGVLSNLLDENSTDVIGYPLPGRGLHFALEGNYQ